MRKGGCHVSQERRTKLDSNGRVVIPARFRHALGIEPGDDVLLRMDEGELRITTQQARIRRAQRRAEGHAKGGNSVVDELLAERRWEARACASK